jgi:hypothetical protein
MAGSPGRRFTRSLSSPTTTTSSLPFDNQVAGTFREVHWLQPENAEVFAMLNAEVNVEDLLLAKIQT